MATDPEDRSIAMGWAVLLGILLVTPIVALLLVFHGLVRGPAAIAGAIDALLGRPAVGLPLLALGIVVHELVHAAVWVLAGRGDWARVHFGWHWRALAPFAHYTDPLPATGYRLGAMAPLVVLGIAPSIAGTLAGWNGVAAFGWLLTAGAAGDVAVLWLLRDVPARALVVDHPARAGCLVHPPPG
jgi:putative zincin peptidase